MSQNSLIRFARGIILCSKMRRHLALQTNHKARLLMNSQRGSPSLFQAKMPMLCVVKRCPRCRKKIILSAISSYPKAKSKSVPHATAPQEMSYSPFVQVMSLKICNQFAEQVGNPTSNASMSQCESHSPYNLVVVHQSSSMYLLH